MKKNSLMVATVLLAGTLMCSSCIGSFSLFNKYEKWQCNMTSSKIVNGIVGLILQPIVGSVCLTADALVLNTIEFWSGSNPLAANVGDTYEVQGRDGRYYAVTVIKEGYEVKAPTGEVTLFTHDGQTDTWSMSQDGKTIDVFRFNQDGTIEAYLQNGQTMTVTADEAGLMQMEQAVSNANANYFAQR
ncbi:MAG: DUF3332 domain-containing protein [Prevotella sp.]|nr:DUF3332 domain-containing protein [Prevotella sp.]